MPDDLGGQDKEVQRRLVRRNRARAISISYDCVRLVDELLQENERLKAKVEELQSKLKPIPHLH